MKEIPSAKETLKEATKAPPAPAPKAPTRPGQTDAEGHGPGNPDGPGKS